MYDTILKLKQNIHFCYNQLSIIIIKAANKRPRPPKNKKAVKLLFDDKNIFIITPSPIIHNIDIIIVDFIILFLVLFIRVYF